MKTLKSFVWLCFIAIAGISTSCDELKEALKADFNYEGDAIYVDIDPIDAPEDGSLQLIGSENYEFNLEYPGSQHNEYTDRTYQWGRRQ
jgi:hypothetical protein